jgi:hypothetical protein
MFHWEVMFRFLLLPKHAMLYLQLEWPVELSCLGPRVFSYSILLFYAFTGPHKDLDEDETDFLDALETVRMANCGRDMGTTNLSWEFLACGCLANLDRMISRYV